MKKKGSAGLAIVGGLLIFGIKLYAWLVSGSVALLSDTLESIVNIFASLMMFISVLVSEKPPDTDHMYGHQKVENISCLLEGILIIAASGFIAWTAIRRISNPVELVELSYAALVSIFATCLNGVLSWLLMKAAKETGSIALEGDAKHLLSDVVSSLGVVVGLYIGEAVGLPIIDPVMALIMAFIVFRMGMGLIRKAVGGLMDESCSKAEAEIRRIMDRHAEKFVDYHDLRTRKSGNKVFAELHLSLDGGLSVQEAHDFTDHLEEDFRRELPYVSLTIHIEPKNDEEK